MVCKLKLLYDASERAHKEKTEAQNGLSYYDFSRDTNTCLSATLSTEYVRGEPPLTGEELERTVAIGVKGDPTLNQLRELVKWVEGMLSD